MRRHTNWTEPYVSIKKQQHKTKQNWAVTCCMSLCQHFHSEKWKMCS